ncbi:MAG: hypothetical protein KDA96_20140, partial [Planctomycetaceae bacterium]|nr:hypothetical protein [Planctomycetaceae bacterium]
MVAWIVATVFGMLVLLGTGQRAGRTFAILLPLTTVPATYRYLTGGGSVVPLDRLNPQPFMVSMCSVFGVLGSGFLLAGLIFGSPNWQPVVLIGMLGVALFEVFRRQVKGVSHDHSDK